MRVQLPPFALQDPDAGAGVPPECHPFADEIEVQLRAALAAWTERNGTAEVRKRLLAALMALEVAPSTR